MHKKHRAEHGERIDHTMASEWAEHHGTKNEWSRRRAQSKHVGLVAVGNVQWHEFFNDEHQRPFWYNKATGQCSWVDPRGP